MAGIKGKCGGRRPGAGRPYKNGCPTKVMRVPLFMSSHVETLIRMMAEWLEEDENKETVGFFDEAEEKKRKELIQDLECIIDYEKKRLGKARMIAKSKGEE